ncbi:MAG: class I SAM-dependent methyltransferase [Anaerolineales bacterium]|jgi:ubiquinone/menaquinone biosynthesis C-methylase UbiE|nr:class I SAM-dependent methyltransferase [Anaerolineales bacterium]
MTESPPVCDYEGSDYQASFWDQGGRAYEDKTEEIALKRMLPAHGQRLLELGAGAGRNTPRYTGYEQIVLLDYSRTQLAQARARLGDSARYVYVAADVYKIPFVEGLFDGATMIRTLHHMADAPKALAQVRRVLLPGATFILEFANKLNLKAILRYWLAKQDWNPFTLEPVEFVALNFDFHPQAIRQWLEELGFQVQKTLTVSHFRIGLLKRLLPASLLAALDGLIQPTGAFWQLTPSVFMKARLGQAVPQPEPASRSLLASFQCPECATHPLLDHSDYLDCPGCGRRWAFRDGIYDFREPLA